jgi:subtilisin family serine protease
MVMSARGVFRLIVLGAAALASTVPPVAARAAASPGDDPLVPLQWGLSAVGAPAAWDVATGDGITIAVVDSGVATDHEDLRAQLVDDGAVSCLGTDGDPTRCRTSESAGVDDDGHGTHVAGIAAADGGNGRGVSGVAPDARLLAIKVLVHECGIRGCGASGTSDDVSAGIRYAVDHGADVINLSLGNTTQAVFGPAFEAAVRYAWDNGVVAVVAAGNDFVLPSGFSDEPALVVAALNRSGQAATYSNGVGNAQWALSAPGGEEDDDASCNGGHPNGIVSTYWVEGDDDAYYCLSGTSMAAPHVAGAVALLRSAGLSPSEAVDRLLRTATDLGLAGRDNTYGAGALDLAAATDGLAPPGASTSTTPGSTSTGGPPDTTPGHQPSTPATNPPDAAATSSSTTTAPPSSGDVAVPTTGAPTELSSEPTTARDDLPRGPVSVAVLLLVGVGTANAWLLLRGAGWARRTPSAPG